MKTIVKWQSVTSIALLFGVTTCLRENPVNRPPDPPYDLVVNIMSPTHASISWRCGENRGDGFIIERRKGFGNYSTLIHEYYIPTNMFSYEDLSLLPCTLETYMTPEETYSYRVYSYNESSKGSFTNILKSESSNIASVFAIYPSISKDYQLQTLSLSPWMTDSVTHNGTRQNGYEDFNLKINGLPGQSTFDFVAQGNPASSTWPSSGTLTFGVNFDKELVRNDNLPISYKLSLFDHADICGGTVLVYKLKISFDYSGPAYGAPGNVSGSWAFYLRN